MSEQKDKTFYMLVINIWDVYGQRAYGKYRHYTREDAEQEALKLVEESEKLSFVYITKAVSRVYRSQLEIERLDDTKQERNKA